MVRIVVGLSPLWLGALFLAFQNHPADAERPMFSGMAANPGDEQPLALTGDAGAAAAGADLAGITASAAETDPEAIAEGPQLAQGASDDEGVLSQSTYGALTVPQPVWEMEPPAPRPERIRPLPRTSAAPAIRPDSPRDATEPSSQDGATLAGARVVIHRPHGEGRRPAADLLDRLQADGVGEAEIRTVGVSLSGTDIRYFHPRDRAIAEALDRMLARQGYSADVKDFTHYAPRPSRGTVEVWLPG